MNNIYYWVGLITTWVIFAAAALLCVLLLIKLWNKIKCHWWFFQAYEVWKGHLWVNRLIKTNDFSSVNWKGIEAVYRRCKTKGDHFYKHLFRDINMYNCLRLLHQPEYRIWKDRKNIKWNKITTTWDKYEDPEFDPNTLPSVERMKMVVENNYIFLLMFIVLIFGSATIIYALYRAVLETIKLF